MADEYGVRQTELAADFHNIVRIAGEAGILGTVVGAKVGVAGADVVEQDSSEVILEGRFYEPPHVLIAPKSVSEHHRSFAAAANVHAVPFDHSRHRHSFSCQRSNVA